MARGKKKDTAQAAPAPEATAPTPKEQEAHLDPGQFQDMDDATLQQLARDMGLDPTAYADREALTAAIAAEPVIPGPSELGGQEGSGSQEDTQEQPTGQDTQEDAQEPFTPYEATVAVPLVVIRRGTTPHPEDRPIGTMTRGTRVTVTNSLGGYAMLANGTYVKESYLER